MRWVRPGDTVPFTPTPVTTPPCGPAFPLAPVRSSPEAAPGATAPNAAADRAGSPIRRAIGPSRGGRPDRAVRDEDSGGGSRRPLVAAAVRHSAPVVDSPDALPASHWSQLRSKEA